MTTLLAAHQAQYLPYVGLLQKVARADIFVLQDDLQYSRSGWQNRNRIRTKDGSRWLTVPVHARANQQIRDVVPAEPNWLKRHRRIVELEYRDSPHLGRAWEVLSRAERAENLADLAFSCLAALLELCGIETPIVLQSSLNLTDVEQASADTRLQALCGRLGADSYLAGIGGRDYMDLASWASNDLAVQWMTGDAIQYKQLHPGWVPNLSSLDFVLCVNDPEEVIINAVA